MKFTHSLSFRFQTVLFKFVCFTLNCFFFWVNKTFVLDSYVFFLKMNLLVTSLLVSLVCLSIRPYSVYGTWCSDSYSCQGDTITDAAYCYGYFACDDATIDGTSAYCSGYFGCYSADELTTSGIIACYGNYGCSYAESFTAGSYARKFSNEKVEILVGFFFFWIVQGEFIYQFSILRFCFFISNTFYSPYQCVKFQPLYGCCFFVCVFFSCFVTSLFSFVWVLICLIKKCRNTERDTIIG